MTKFVNECSGHHQSSAIQSTLLLIAMHFFQLQALNFMSQAGHGL